MKKLFDTLLEWFGDLSEGLQILTFYTALIALGFGLHELGILKATGDVLLVLWVIGLITFVAWIAIKAYRERDNRSGYFTAAIIFYIVVLIGMFHNANNNNDDVFLFFYLLSIFAGWCWKTAEAEWSKKMEEERTNRIEMLKDEERAKKIEMLKDDDDEELICSNCGAFVH